MAKDSSFDVVSEVNMQEVDNAFQQTTREISQRYDLKDSGATIELSKGDKLFTINAPADFVSKQIIDVLSSKLIKRGIDLKAVSWDAPQAASGGTVRVLGHIVEGIDQATAKKIKKYIGGFAAAMNGLDAIIFTGGIGENAPEVRRDVCADMDFFGIKLDNAKNDEIKGKLCKISAPDSKVEVWVVPTNEELLIARDTLALISK